MLFLPFKVVGRFYCCCWFLLLVLAFLLLAVLLLLFLLSLPLLPRLLEAARNDATAARNVREPSRA